jgi:hypothetical protein
MGGAQSKNPVPLPCDSAGKSARLQVAKLQGVGAGFFDSAPFAARSGAALRMTQLWRRSRNPSVDFLRRIEGPSRLVAFC